MKLPHLELSHWSKSSSFLSRLSYHQLLLFTGDFLPIIVLCAFNLSWYFSSPLLICKCFAVIQSPIYSCYKIQPSFFIWAPSAIWGKGKWSDLSVFDKSCDNRMFQGGHVESSFMFGQENWFMMICDTRKVFTEFSFGIHGEWKNHFLKKIQFNVSLSWWLFVQIPSTETLSSENQHITFPHH